MALKDTIYQKSPIFFQNLMVSAYGLKLFYERYGGNQRKYLINLLKSQWWSVDEILAYQRKEFLELIHRVYTHVPYYRALFEKHGLNVKDFSSVEDIKKLPILDKETVRTNADLLVSQHVNKRRITSLNTSGTTGKSLRVFVDIDSRRKEYAFIERSQTWAGLKGGRHGVIFGGRPIVPNDYSKVFWRYNMIMDNYLFSSYHMSEENLPHYISKLRKINPIFIDGYPSSIYMLASFMNRNSIKGINPRAILTTAETLLDYQRDHISKAFGCPVTDQYGCTEQTIFVSQCEKGSYHVNPEYGLVEIVDDDGIEVKPGDLGRIVCTSFVNEAMPLIRYDLGDMVVKGDHSCECGRNFPVVEKIYGRKDDFICTPDGKKIGRLDPIFKGLTSIKMAQIVQHTLNEVEIRIVPGKNYKMIDGEILRNEMKKRVGEFMTVTIVLVKDIEKTATGKFQAVVSHVTV